MSIHVHEGVTRVAETLRGRGGRSRGDGTDTERRLLATVMGLPLVDGVFPAVVLAGGLDSPLGVIQTGLLVLGGTATASVLVSSEGLSVSEVMGVGALVSLGAGIVAGLAPTFETLVRTQTFDFFAVATVLTVAASVATDAIDKVLPRPRNTVGVGLLVSLDPSGFEVVVLGSSLVLKGVGAGVVATAFAVSVVALRPYLSAGEGIFDARRLRLASGASLASFPLTVYGLSPEAAPLGVLAVGVLASAVPADVASATEPDNA